MNSCAIFFFHTFRFILYYHPHISFMIVSDHFILHFESSRIEKEHIINIIER